MSSAMSSGPEPHRTGPYADAALTYRAAGWMGVIPIPYKTKRIRAEGWTGHGGTWPSGADVQAWIDSSRADEGGGNIVLRLPPDVIGLDVDAYGDKTGGDTLAGHVERWGELPATWTSTAREDGVSGIRFYRVPEGLRWPGQAGPHIEIIQTSHRYAVVCPSVHPDAGRYRWNRPDGIASTAPPRPDELPDLPDAWIVGLTGGELAETVHSAGLSDGQARDWLVGHSPSGPCRAMLAVRDRLLSEMRTGSAHESLRRLLGLVRLAEQGHRGLVESIGVVRDAFLAEATNASRTGQSRSVEDAEAEWRRSLTGAVNRVAGAPSAAEGPDGPDVDPCDQPFAGLVSSPAERELADALRVLPGAEHGELIQRDAGEDSDGSIADGATEDEPERTSWWPRDLLPVLDGDDAEPPPAVLAREDKQCLFYSGKVNGLLGESESGKTWIALLAVAQALEAGHDVLYLDFEDAASGITTRLAALGVPREAMLAHFTYIDPDEDLHGGAAADLADVLATRTYEVIVIDGVNAAMSLLGLELEKNSDATRFSQKLLRPLARTGAAVITIDHVGKNKETRGKGGIGAQAKRAMITGCSIAVEVTAPFGRGQTGRLRLTVDKDRGGHVRGMAENGKFVGQAVMCSASSGDHVTVSIELPNQNRISGNGEKFRPTGVMTKVSQFLLTTTGDVSQQQIEAAVAGRATVIRAALDCLVEEGFVSRHTGPRNAILHSHVSHYSELDELTGDDDADL